MEENIISLIWFALVVLFIVAGWKIYTKAGKPGWTSVIPLYNAYTWMQIAGRKGWEFLLLLIPIYNIYLTFVINIAIAKKFGKSTAFGVGLVLLSPIFILILAFGKASYNPNA